MHFAGSGHGPSQDCEVVICSTSEPRVVQDAAVTGVQCGHLGVVLILIGCGASQVHATWGTGFGSKTSPHISMRRPCGQMAARAVLEFWTLQDGKPVWAQGLSSLRLDVPRIKNRKKSVQHQVPEVDGQLRVLYDSWLDSRSRFFTQSGNVRS